MGPDENGEMSGKLFAANKACPSFLPTNRSVLKGPLRPAEVAENTVVLRHLVKVVALEARLQVQQIEATKAVVTAIEKQAAKSVQASNVKFCLSENVKCLTAEMCC